MSRIPLDLYAEVEDASGTRYRWDHNQAPGSRLRNFSFRTKIGEGFSDASGMLARRIDLDYPDVNLLNSVTFVGADGSVAYEGRIEAMPRELSDTHSIGVTLAGWMAHAKDRKFREIYRDMSFGRWGPIAASSKAGLYGIGYTNITDPVVHPSVEGTSQLVLTMAFVGTSKPLAGALYETNGIPLGSIYAAWTGTGFTPPTSRYLAVELITPGGSTDGNVDIEATSGTTTTTATADTRTQARLYWFLNAAAASGTIENPIYWSTLAVYGYHGLTKRGTEPSAGFYASDMIRDIASRFCPQLDTSGVQDTTHVIEQAAFHERTYPYDAFLELNKHHLWHLGVWENRTLHYRPYDLTDYDWEIRTDDPGTTFSPQGPSTESLFNGITVSYQDYAGASFTITPDDDSSLADSSSTNPWNMHGLDHWDEITLSTISTEDEAIRLGQAALADRNAPKNPGTITVKGYIRDRAGNYQPCWKVRAGDTIAITNFPNDSPRLIVETDYNDESKEVRIAVDRPFQLLEAYLDRQANALQARNL